MGLEGLAPSALLLLAGLSLDAILGDPQVSFHPIRLLGRTLSGIENVLRRAGLDSRVGGIVLFLVLSAVWVVLPSLFVHWLATKNYTASVFVHAFTVYILFALGDLVDHVRAVERAARRGDLAAARAAVSMFVGRDTDRLSVEDCRRAAIESLSESFVDGFLSPLFWYLLLGLPGLLLFKVVSTMDSMVGFKTPKYLHFGWCGARLDDLMNYIPARAGWLLLGLAAVPLRGLSAAKGWKLGLEQHSIVPGPNPGWSEATMAGVLTRRLIGPIWKGGTLVTDVWLGDPTDPPAGSDKDILRSLGVTLVAAALAVLIGILSLIAFPLASVS